MHSSTVPTASGQAQVYGVVAFVFFCIAYALLTLFSHLRTHTMDPVPFMIYSSTEEFAGVDSFTEETAAATGLYISAGHTLMEKLVKA